MSRFAAAIAGRPQLVRLLILLIPALLAACNVCGLCALFCPEGAMRREDGTMVIDFDHCKGCGICEDVCPVQNAITMEEVLV